MREAFHSPHFLCFDRRVDHENHVLFFSIVIGPPNRFLRKMENDSLQYRGVQNKKSEIDSAAPNIAKKRSSDKVPI